jgi:hypothetical protein
MEMAVGDRKPGFFAQGSFQRGTYKAMFVAIVLASVFVIWVLGCFAHRIYMERTAHHETFVIVGVGTGTRPLSWEEQLADEAAAFLSGR